MSKQQSGKTKILSSLKGHMEELAVKDLAMEHIKDGIEEEFYTAKGIICTLWHVYSFETGEEMNFSDTGCLLSLANEHMDSLMEKLDKLFAKAKK